MNILVTGATGFIGSCLVPRLRAEGHDVWVLARYVSGGRYDYYGRDRVVFADLRDGEAVRSAVLQVKPQVVIHLAAQTAVSFSFLNPVDVFHTNTIGTIHLAEATRDSGLEQFIFASTSEYYGNQQELPIKEDTLPNPTSPYAVSKIACENYLWLLHRLYDFPLTVMRPFNSYNRSHLKNKHYVVERAVTGALEEGVIRLHNAKPVRDFVYRDDHVEGYCKVLGKGIGEAFNLCTGTGHSIEEMANLVANLVEKKINKRVKIEFGREPDRPLDIWTLVGSPEKAKRLLGWEPHYNLESGLGKTIDDWAKVLGL